MQYLTKNFHSKFHIAVVTEQSDNDIKCCINKLNKWLSKQNQQDVKVDNFNFSQEWSGSISECRTNLTIIYHHE